MRIAETSPISTSVGRIENSVKLISVEMPRVPRSTSRVSPPVWRARWKRSDSACRWRNTLSAIVRTARCVTLANRNSRSSVNDGRRQAHRTVGGEQRERQHQRSAGRSDGRRSPSAPAARRRWRAWPRSGTPSRGARGPCTREGTAAACGLSRQSPRNARSVGAGGGLLSVRRGIGELAPISACEQAR